jgi:hypothetical protein
MKISSEGAFELSRWFRELSVELGNYRYEHWKTLKKSERQALEDAEWSLLNASSDMTTVAVGLVLDESEASFDRLKASTERAKAAVKTLKVVRKVVNVATAAVGLAAAVLSRDPGAIGKNAKSLFEAATADA